MKRFLTAIILVTAGALAASPEEFATSAGPLQLTPIQHASLMIQAGGKVLYIDPAQGKYDGLPPADAAAEAVRAFHPAIVYPYHYNGSDLSVFEKGLAGSGIEVRIRDWYPK
jgi:L-ascorbate metabolism protein UlaG (beta-lactamase superfamily)